MTAPAPVVSLGGGRIPWELARQLLTVTVDRGLRRPARAELTFADDGFEILRRRTAALAPGTPLTVALPDGTGSCTVFRGVVTGLRVSCPEGGQHHTALTVVGQDPTHRLVDVQQVTTSAGATLATALGSVVGRHGLRLVDEGLPGTSLEHVLVASTPMDLLEQVCDRYHLDWWYDVEDGALHLAPPPAGPTAVALRLGEDVADLDVEGSVGAPGTVALRAWDPEGKRALVGEHTAAQAPGSRATAFHGSRTVGAVEAGRRYEARAVTARDADDAKAQAGAVAERAATGTVQLRATTFGLVPRLAPRTDLDLRDAGPLSGRYPVTQVRHEWGATVATWVVAGARGAAAPSAPSAPHSPYAGGAAAASGPAVAATTGVMLAGVVCDIKDPKGRGRVRVALPTLGAGVRTGWARTLLPAAGPGRGFVVPHRVDDEVVVGFEEGDLQRPIVLGAVHNGKDAVPSATAGRDSALAAGLTTGDGHQLVVTDDARSRARSGLRFGHADGHQLVVAGDHLLVEASRGTPLTLKSGEASIVLDAGGNVTIKGVKVSVTATSAVEVKGVQASLKADGQLTLQGLATTVKGATVAVNADGMATVKGATVAIN